MLTKEIQAGLEQWAARVDDTRRRVREAGPAEKAASVRYAAQCRREAFKYLATTCGSLRGWPGREQVGDQGVLAAHRILLALDGLEIRKVLPLVTAAAAKHRIPPRFLAEATDALCVAERRPQVYGTAAGHPVADEARVDALRAALGLPPLAPQPLLQQAFPARKPTPDEPLPAELAVLEGLLRELPPVVPLPRTVRATVAAHSVWGCAYCGGPAGRRRAPGASLHPQMLISTRAERLLTRPHDQPLEPGQITKALQIAHATSVKQHLHVRTVGDLAALFHSPPDWLLDLHRKLAAERTA